MRKVVKYMPKKLCSSKEEKRDRYSRLIFKCFNESLIKIKEWVK